MPLHQQACIPLVITITCIHDVNPFTPQPTSSTGMHRVANGRASVEGINILL
jgi:hypothetical protein